MIVPQAWIASAILAAVSVFGSLGGPVHIVYRNLPGGGLAAVEPPRTIVLDRRASWVQAVAQCTIAHEYVHLVRRAHHRRDWMEHSTNPRSLMYFKLLPATCERFLRRHLPRRTT